MPPSPGVKLYDRATGKPVEFASGDEAQAAFASGKFAPKKTDRIPVALPTGEIGTVLAQDLMGTLADGGRMASGQELQHAEREAKYGGAGGALGAALAGAARGLTIGLSDPILTGFGGEGMRERLSAYEDIHPYASTGGELAGIAASMALPGVGEAAAARGLVGTARVAKGLGGLAKGVTAAGNLAERGALSLLGEGGGLAARIARAGATTAARGAAEGALFGAGQAVSEASLGDHELTAEKLFAGMGQGALFGGLTGGVIGGGGEALKATGEKIVPLLRPALAREAEEQAFRALSATKPFMKRIDTIPGGARGVGRELLDSGLIAPGDTLETLVPKLAKAREETGDALGRLLLGADEAGLAGPKVSAIVAQIEKQVMPRLNEMPLVNAGTIGAVRNVVDDFAAKMGGLDARTSFQDLQRWRALLDDKIRFNTSPLLPTNELMNAYKGIRTTLESSLVEAGEAAAKERGASFAKEYNEAKLRYRRLISAEQAAEDALTRSQANQAHSLTDKIMGAATGAAALATHGPLGLLAGPIASSASKLIRERGNSTAAVLLDKASAFGAVERQIKRVDTEIDNAVAKFFGKHAEAPKLKAPAEVKAPKESPAKEYERRVQEVTAAVADKPRAAALVLAKTQPLADHMPTVRSAIADTAMRATAYLESHMPAGRVEEFSATPHLDKPSVSDIQRQQFLDRARTVSNPMSAVQDFARGRASREQIEALRVVYPKLYQQLVARVDDQLASRKTPVPYQKVIQLSSVLGRGLSATQDPMFIMALNKADMAQAPKGKAPAMPSAPPFKTSTMLQTTTQRVEGR